MEEHELHQHIFCLEMQTKPRNRIFFVYTNHIVKVIYMFESKQTIKKQHIMENMHEIQLSKIDK
jgi:hypothetical protein